MKTFYDYLNEDNKDIYKYLLEDKKKMKRYTHRLGLAVATEIIGGLNDDVNSLIGSPKIFDYVVENKLISSRELSNALNYLITQIAP